jgi:tRNA G18 (ribose-2'-O)-methylase SpoU
VIDPGDPRVDDFRGLTDARARADLEAERGIFVAEGTYAVDRVLASGLEVRAVLAVPAKAERLRTSGVQVLCAPRQVFADIVGFRSSRGVIASVARPPAASVEDLVGRSPLLVLEGIADPENLGSLFRAAAALGATGVILDPRTADPWTRRSVRVSVGAVCAVPFARAGTWPGVLTELGRAGYDLVALTPADDAVPIDRLVPSGRTALMVGTEAEGLTTAALEESDRRVRIPMASGMDSLNVSHAAAIALHHLRTAGSAQPSRAARR